MVSTTAGRLAGFWSPRRWVLETVAADIYSGYIALRSRRDRAPELIGPADWQAQHRRAAARVLDTAVSLGGVLIKAGQFASTRPDLLPAPYIETLAALQDRVPPRPWLAIEPAIAQELSRRPEAVFTTIEREPIAAASLAQVHRARLKDGREVAVKVQYPEIEGLVDADLKALDRIVTWIARAEPAVRLQPIVDHLRATLPLELDFRREAVWMGRLRAALAHRGDVVIPAAIEGLSTKRLLVMDFLEGIKITDRTALVEAGLDPHAVAALVNDVYAEQLLRLGLLHGDPHPGNLLVQPGPRLVLLDHGLTVQLPAALVDAFRRMATALRRLDAGMLAAAMADAGFPVAGERDLASLLPLAGVLLGGQRASGAFDVIRRLGPKLGQLPAELVLVVRALGLLGGITQDLDPRVDMRSILARYVRGPDDTRSGESVTADDRASPRRREGRERGDE